MIAQTAMRLREQIAHFSGNLSRGLSKPARRLVEEAIYGIQARQSVHLTEIARSLEEKIPLIKTENRLSRNLARPNLRLTLQDALVRQGAKRMGEDTLRILDLSDPDRVQRELDKSVGFQPPLLGLTAWAVKREEGADYQSGLMVSLQPLHRFPVPLRQRASLA